MMKKVLIATACAVCSVSAWTQAPAAIGTDYERTAVHFLNGEKHFVNSDVLFDLNSGDKETGLNYVEFSLNGVKFMQYKRPFQLLEEGPHTISYRGFDNSGNLEVPKTLSVIVDNTPPRASLETTEPLYRKSSMLYCSANTKWYVSASDILGESGVAAAYLGSDLNALENRGVGKEEEKAYVSFVEEGLTNLYYTAVDNVGNLTPIALKVVTVDTTPPVVDLVKSHRLINKDSQYTVFPSSEIVDAEGNIIVSTSETVSFKAKDELSGVEAIYIKINEGEYTKYVEPVRFKQNDIYTIEVKAADNVGNVSEPVTYRFYVDKITPASDIKITDRDGNELPVITPGGAVMESDTEMQPAASEQVGQ